MLYNQNKSCVKSCQNHCFKNPLFSKKTHCFPTCALFYPIVLKRKIITALHRTHPSVPTRHRVNISVFNQNFSPNGCHLSDAGQERFLSNIRAAVVAALKHSDNLRIMQ